jgi:DNA invertase Pin-like site-specific DNA recombinase
MSRFAEAAGSAMAAGPRRIAIYGAGDDSQLLANQRTAIRQYADAMGWITVTAIENDPDQLMTAVRTGTIDMVVCWRYSEVETADGLSEMLQAHGVEVLALAQSCSALLE